MQLRCLLPFAPSLKQLSPIYSEEKACTCHMVCVSLATEEDARSIQQYITPIEIDGCAYDTPTCEAQYRVYVCITHVNHAHRKKKDGTRAAPWTAVSSGGSTAAPHHEAPAHKHQQLASMRVM